MKNRKPFPRWLLVLMIAAVSSALLWLAFFPKHRATQKTSHPVLSTVTAARTADVYLPTRASLPGQPAVISADLPPASDPAERSPIADRLNLPESNIGTDLGIVRDLLDAYRRAYGAFPVGEDNPQILNALSGTNPKHLVFIARSHPALSPDGALLDRWSTPYFFHFQSSQEVEIRSAGPDREFYTPDDLLRPSR